MKYYTLGIDLGTSGVKVGVLDLRALELTRVAVRDYDNSALQQSTPLWEATSAAILEAVTGIQKDRILAIGLTGQMHGTVLYDAQGAVIEPIINWQDTRCDAPKLKYGNRTTVETMMDLLDPAEFDDLGVDILASGFLGATLFHIRENDPALMDRIRHVVLPVDFIRAQLLGTCDFATDPTNACSTGLFNTRLSEWHAGVIQKLGLPHDVLPFVHNTMEIAGTLPPHVAHALQLRVDTPVIYGGGDNQMSILGNGLISGDSPVALNIGTGAQISKVIPHYAKIVGLDTRSFFDGAYVFVGACLGGGGSYAHLRDTLQRQLGRDIGYREMDALAAQVAIGADGLAFKPGTRREVRRQEGFTGHTELRSVGHQARAVMEGVLLALYRLRPAVDADGPDFMVGSGKGLQKSRVWAQMASDLFDRPIRITNFENAIWGAATMAAVSVGALHELGDAVKTIRYSGELMPNLTDAAKYRELIARRTDSLLWESKFAG